MFQNGVNISFYSFIAKATVFLCGPLTLLLISHKLSTDKIHESKPKVTKTLLEYNNGICTKEGMARNGKKFKKGSFKKRANNEGIRTLRLYSNIPYTPDESEYKSDFKYEI